MSDWQTERLRVSLKGPLHCGDRPLGFVARTLPFVPGHVPLMALTPVLVRQADLGETPAAYEAALSFLKTHLRFTPFFLLDAAEGKPLFPFESKGLRIIETTFLASSQHVAIDYASRGAQEGFLFEMESIQPRIGPGRSTCLEGYLFWKTGKDHALCLDPEGRINGLPLRDLIGQSLWGGERNRGYGVLAGVEFEMTGDIWGVELPPAENGPHPVLTWPARKAAPLRLQFAASLADSVSGSLTPISGRLYDSKKGPGQAAPEPLIVWEAGWQTETAIRLEIGAKAAVFISPDFS